MRKRMDQRLHRQVMDPEPALSHQRFAFSYSLWVANVPLRALYLLDTALLRFPARRSSDARCSFPAFALPPSTASASIATSSFHPCTSVLLYSMLADLLVRVSVDGVVLVDIGSRVEAMGHGTGGKGSRRWVLCRTLSATVLCLMLSAGWVVGALMVSGGAKQAGLREPEETLASSRRNRPSLAGNPARPGKE